MNYMQANPENFQFIIFDKERQPRSLQLNYNVIIQSVSIVKLLGVNIDVELNFKSSHSHVAYARFLRGGGPNFKISGILDIHAAKRHVASSEAAILC